MAQNGIEGICAVWFNSNDLEGSIQRGQITMTIV